MARCGCSSDCLCTVRGSGCITVAGAGSSNNPYVATLKLDPDVDNLLECTADGLLVTVETIPVYTEDSDCIDLTGDGTPVDPIVASPRIDPVAGNGLSCSEAGLVATAVGVPHYLPVNVVEDHEAAFGELVVVDSTAADVTVSLPPAAGVVGGVVTIKKIVAANDVVVDGYALQEVDGSGSITLTAQWASATLVSDGTTWFVIGEV